MLKTVPHAAFASFRDELRRAVTTSFPGFGYAPSEIERFLSLNAEPYDDVHYLLEEDGRVLAVAMRCGELLEYVVPTVWEGRYGAVARTVALIREAHPELRLQIKEDLPSHASWYAGLLPSLGFEMIPRTRLGASVAGLLEEGAREVPFRLAPIARENLDECVALYREAYELAHDRAEELEASLRASAEVPDRWASWTVAFDGDRLVGSCFGGQHRGFLFVEELAVAEDRRGKGLGRQLLLQSVRRLASAFPDATTAVLDVDRMNRPAVDLYASLGFAPQARYTVARRGAS